MSKLNDNNTVLKLKNNGKAHIFPVNTENEAEINKVLEYTHSLFIGAHEDDMLAAPRPVLDSFYGKGKCASVTLTDGSGAPSKKLKAEEMVAIRLQEGKEAATRANLSLNINLAYTSDEAKGDKKENIIADLMDIIIATKPKAIWTLAPTDEHTTHLVTCNLVVEALNRLREKELYGCPQLYGVQIWGNDLDSIAKDSKVKRFAFALTDDELKDFKTILEAYTSQNEEHNYAEGTVARFTASSTFTGSHETKTEKAVTFAVDMTGLVMSRLQSAAEFALAIQMEKVQKTIDNHIKCSVPTPIIENGNKAKSWASGLQQLQIQTASDRKKPGSLSCSF